MTHSVPFHTVFRSNSMLLFLSFSTGLGGEMDWSRNSRTLADRSISNASAKRPSCFSSSSCDFGCALKNGVVYKGAFVPLPRRLPRPFGTPVLKGARPPTVHTVPTLTYFN
jgi:hypothetical protein